MAISFNNWVQGAAGGVFLRANGVFATRNYIYDSLYDYFSDSPSVNDCAIFSVTRFAPYRGAGRWKNLKLNIGTARTNAGAGVWEYSGMLCQMYSGTDGVLNYVSDGTSSQNPAHSIDTGDLLEFGLRGNLPPGLLGYSSAVYYARVLDSKRITVHPTRADALAGTNAFGFSSVVSSVYAQVWKPLSCTDNTQGLTAAGVNTVEFDVPADWAAAEYHNATSTQGLYTVRYRLTDVSGIVEGGRNAAQISGGDFSFRVEGYSSTTPCTFEDLRAWDAAQGLGLVVKRSACLYEVNAGLVIGDGTTPCYFADSDKTIAMGGSILVLSYGSLQLGVLTNGVYPEKGCTLCMREAGSYRYFSVRATGPRAALLLYDCDVREHGYIIAKGDLAHQEFIGCFFFGRGPECGGDQTWNRVTVNNAYEGISVSAAPTGSISDAKLVNTSLGVAWGMGRDSSTTLSIPCTNITFLRPNTFSLRVPYNYVTKNIDFDMVDCVGFDYTQAVDDAGSYHENLRVNERYTCALTVRDPMEVPVAGVTVRIENAVGSWEGLTDSAGLVTLQPVVNRKVLETNTLLPGGACTVTLQKPGYVLRVVRGVSIGEKSYFSFVLTPCLTSADMTGGLEVV